MPIFCQNNVQSLKNTVLSCPKLHYIMGPKSQKDALFFLFFTTKYQLLCPYFVRKTSILKKTRYSYAHSLSKKRPLSQKHNAFMSSFSFFHEKPLLSCPYLVQKKHWFCQNYTILWDKKVNRIPFLLIFYQKITALMPTFCQKNAYSLKTPRSNAHILSKNRPFSQKHVAHM